MRSRKLSEHVEDELFNKEKRNNEPKPVEVIKEIVEDVKPVLVVNATRKSVRLDGVFDKAL